MARLDVRLDAEQTTAAGRACRGCRGEPISEVVRCLIDEAYEAVMRERRREAVRRLAGLEVEDPPDAATSLSRELEAAHEPGGVG